MGHRANLIVVREGRYDLRSSHWAANTLPRDLFWGPQHAIAFTEAQPAAGTDWLDDVWAEGGSVIDTDRHVFRLFGGEDLQYNVPLRRLYLALLGVIWQGWSVGWADEGIADLADLVGYPRELLLCREHDGIPAPDLRPPDELDRVDFVGSVRLGDRTSTFLNGGFHLDLRSNSLNYWTAGDQPGVSARIAARWPEWSVTWLRDRYEDQLAACGGLLSFPDRTPDALFADLRSMLLREPGVSPTETVLWFAERERAAGKVVEINTHALRDDRVELPLVTRTEILHRASVQLGFS
jgi:hypothetical protein